MYFSICNHLIVVSRAAVHPNMSPHTSRLLQLKTTCVPLFFCSHENDLGSNIILYLEKENNEIIFDKGKGVEKIF
jgi:hypothetical protein